jgi:hypothetical protein
VWPVRSPTPMHGVRLSGPCSSTSTNRRGDAHELANTPDFAKAQPKRKKVEALFAELKNQIGLRRLRLRRLKFVRGQFLMAAAVQNIRRLVRFLSPPAAPQSRITQKRKEKLSSTSPSPHKTGSSTEFFNSRRCLHSSSLPSLWAFRNVLRQQESLKMP